ncbi:MAG: hypothetical protein V3U29_00560 [Phycisphaeraceae bacterium]
MLQNRTARGVVLAAVLLSMAAPAVFAQAQDMWLSRRLIRLFDFEERDGPQPNFEDLPKHWYVMGRPHDVVDPNFLRQPIHRELLNRPNFSKHTQVRFDQRHKVSGEFSLYLGLNGGSSGAFLDIGTVPVLAHSDLVIIASLRTSPLRHGRARLVAYFVDDRGNRIDQSVVSTGLLETNDQWQRVSVRLLGDFADAAYLGIQLEAIQQQFDPDSPLGGRQLTYRETEGGVWFDDVAVWQLPRVHVTTQSPVNIISEPDQPRVNVEVRDLTGRAIVADLALYDERLQRVAHHRTPAGAGAPVTWSWTPVLPRHGWYLIDLNVYETAEAGDDSSLSLVGRRLGAFLWLGAESPMLPADKHRFSLLAEQLHDQQLALLPKLLDATQLSSAIVSTWRRDTTLSNLDKQQSRLDALLEGLFRSGRQVSLSLNPLPDSITGPLKLDTARPLMMFGKPEAAWLGYLAPVLLKHGQHVRRWHLGTTSDPADLSAANLPRMAARANATFGDLAPRPRTVLPWRLDYPRRLDLPEQVEFAIDVPEAIRPQSMREHLQEWLEPQPARFHLHLNPPPATRLAHPGRIDDLTLRMLHGWEAGASGLAIRTPWTGSANRRVALLPDPLLGVFRTVAHRLAGRRAVGRLSIGPGLEAMIFDGPAGGMLAMWNQSAPDDRAVVAMYLGRDPVTIDVWGNRTPLELNPDGVHQVALSPTPLFIDRIDAKLALFRAAFTIDPPFIESTQTLHERTITLYNPWPRTMSGYMQFTGPKGWQVQPARRQFSIPSGQTMTIPVAVRFPISEVAGRKRLTARFDFIADRRYRVDVSAPMKLGLPGIDFDANVTLEVDPETGATDAVVNALTTNTGDEPVALYSFAQMPDHPRQERIISRLMPGQSTVRRFRFPDVGPDLSQISIRVGLRATNGPAMLNQIVRADLN